MGVVLGRQIATRGLHEPAHSLCLQGDLAMRHRPLALAVCTRFLGDRDLAAEWWPRPWSSRWSTCRG